MRKTKKYKTGHQASFFGLYVLTGLILLSLVFSYNTLKTGDVKQKSVVLAQLPVPKISQLTYPQPLLLPNYLESVLGAQIFDAIDVVHAINKERIARNIKPLRLNITLMQAAQKRADVIMKYENFSHIDPYENIELATVLPSLNYSFVYATENIGMGGASGADFALGFMNSTMHRENLLNPVLTETGAGLATGPFGKYYVNTVVQIFAIPAGKNEYLGYSKEDIDKFNSYLLYVNSQLNGFDWFWGRLTKNPKYSDDHYLKLTQMKFILDKLTQTMKTEKPFTNSHVALIREFNDLLES